ncbi:MAG: GNAT family N-acetyltransferase [Saprospiraceae bacterium]|nr:GNAT family N-acetyltransferase [Saprospiraceae bacterium]
MLIRKILKEDNPVVAKMIRQVFIEHNAPQQGTVYSDPTTDHLFALFQKEKSVLWVVEVNENIVGCCGVYPTHGLPENCVKLVKFFMDLEKHKQKKKNLWKMYLSKDFGYTSVYIESLPEFAKAINMYEKQGFVTLDQPLGASGHTSCNIWMLKPI